MNPQDYVQQKAAASGSSFYYAFLFLPPERRTAITAFYAFCREVDDVVDEVSDPGVAQTKLAWWRSEVAQAFAGEKNHPVMQALMPHTASYGIEARHLLAVIDGCQMDLDQNRYLDFANLQQYCHLVAGVVGEVAASIFGQTQAQTTAYAHRLGLAFQLTNIIRDVGEDAARGRIYLPVNELQRFDVKAHELIKRGAAPGMEVALFRVGPRGGARLGGEVAQGVVVLHCFIQKARQAALRLGFPCWPVVAQGARRCVEALYLLGYGVAGDVQGRLRFNPRG